MVILTNSVNDSEKEFLDNFCKINKISRSEVIRQMLNLLERDSSFIDFSKTSVKMSPDWLEKNQNRVHNILEGLIFSDASLEWVGRYPRIYFCQTLRHGEYCDYIASMLDINERLTSRDRYDKRTNKIYQIREFKTLKSKSLISYYKRWYNNGKKIIPNDFVITSESLLHAYLGDGYLTYGDAGNKICISTHCFNVDDIKKIVIPQLIKIGIGSGLDCRNTHQYILRIHWSDRENFFNFIGKSPVKCFEYKWPEEFR